MGVIICHPDALFSQGFHPCISNSGIFCKLSRRTLHPCRVSGHRACISYKTKVYENRKEELGERKELNIRVHC